MAGKISRESGLPRKAQKWLREGELNDQPETNSSEIICLKEYTGDYVQNPSVETVQTVS